MTTITDEQAQLLANHVIFVQGGFSTPEVERVRAEADIASGTTIDWDKYRDEVGAAIIARTKPMASAVPDPDDVTEPTAPAGAQQVTITAVQTDIDMAISLRDRIKDLKRQLGIHEQAIKDVMGAATSGVDSTGRIVVEYPVRNRKNLVAAKVKEKLTDAEFGECQTTTTYRVLLFEDEA